MPRLKKQLIVVGDRLLIRPEEGEERTNAGLYLPQTAVAARQAKGGWVVSVGPGHWSSLNRSKIIRGPRAG